MIKVLRVPFASNLFTPPSYFLVFKEPNAVCFAPLGVPCCRFEWCLKFFNQTSRFLGQVHDRLSNMLTVTLSRIVKHCQQTTIKNLQQWTHSPETVLEIPWNSNLFLSILVFHIHYFVRAYVRFSHFPSDTQKDWRGITQSNYCNWFRPYLRAKMHIGYFG